MPWIYYPGADGAGRRGLFRVQMQGGPGERLGELPNAQSVLQMQIGPDGRQVVAAFFDEQSGFPAWALENFLPSATKR